MMARSLSQSLIRIQSQAHSSRIQRQFSSSPGQPENSHAAEPDAVVQRIEDVIHRILVKRSAPDWLPFLPGTSYWVPPRRYSHGVAQLVHKLATTLTHEELLSITSLRAWPSAAYHLNGESTNLDVEETASANTSQSEDEEG